MFNFKALALTAVTAVTLAATATPAQADLSNRWSTENNARQTQEDTDRNLCLNVAKDVTHKGHWKAFADRGNTVVQITNSPSATNTVCTMTTWIPGKTVDAGSQYYKHSNETVYFQNTIKVEGYEVALYTRTYNDRRDSVKREVVGEFGNARDYRSSCFHRAEYIGLFGASKEALLTVCRQEKVAADRAWYNQQYGS